MPTATNGRTEQDQLNSFVAQQLKSTSSAADSFKLGLENTLKQIDEGYRSTMKMYKVSFYVGIVLISFSIMLALRGTQDILSMVFGGFGVGNTIVFFLARPAKKLQESRSRLAQLQAALFTWFTDIYNWNSYLMAVDKSGQMNFETISAVSDKTIENTRKTVELIGAHIEPKED